MNKTEDIIIKIGDVVYAKNIKDRYTYMDRSEVVGVLFKIYAVDEDDAKFGIRILNRYNASSSDGVFWVNKKDLKVILNSPNLETLKTFYLADLIEEFKNFPVKEEDKVEYVVPANKYAIECEDKIFAIAKYLESTIGSDRNFYRKEFKGEKKIMKLKNAKEVMISLNGFLVKVLSYEKDLEENDPVVIEKDDNIYEIVKIHSLDGENEKYSKYPVKYNIVCKIDIKPHLERVNIIKKALELKKEMKKRAEKIKELQIFMMMAKEDKDMNDLLNEYKKLSNLIED